MRHLLFCVPGLAPERVRRNRKRGNWNDWRIVWKLFWRHKGDCSGVFLAMNQYRGRTGMSSQLATCIECGCNDIRACEHGFWWERVDYKVGLGVCSECAHRVKDWDRGNRTLSGTTRMLLEMPIKE